MTFVENDVNALIALQAMVLMADGGAHPHEIAAIQASAQNANLSESELSTILDAVMNDFEGMCNKALASITDAFARQIAFLGLVAMAAIDDDLHEHEAVVLQLAKSAWNL